MKDMERWAKIQNRQKDSVRAASPVLKGGLDDDRKQSKSADAGFAIFERKVREPGGKNKTLLKHILVFLPVCTLHVFAFVLITNLFIFSL